MNSQLLTNDNIPWDVLSSLGELTLLIYDFMKHWDFKKLDNLNNFLKSEKNNENLCENDITLLKGLKEKYPNGEVLKFFTNRTDLQCAVCKSQSKKKFAIVFRGSESTTDWIYDFMVWKTAFKYGNKTFGKVHFGFYRQIMANNFMLHLSTLVEEQIKLHPDYEWELTGHSAGGAQCTLVGYLLAYSFPEKHFTINSLAAPRVGDKIFAKLFQNKQNLTHYRICYNRDIITAVPMIGYYHTGTSLLYVENKWEINSNHSFYIYRCWSISDHSVDKYVKALNNNKM